MYFYHDTSSKGTKRGYKRLLWRNIDVEKAAKEQKRLIRREVDHNLEEKVGFVGASDAMHGETAYDAEENKVNSEVGVQNAIMRWNNSLFQGSGFGITRLKSFEGRETSRK